jgi:membrane-associated phospholipid phosphatase
MTRASRPQATSKASLRLAIAAMVPGLMLMVACPACATNFFDREIMELVQDHRSDDLDHLMKALSSEWNKENFFLASLAAAAYGDETCFRAAQECLKSITLSEAVVSPLKYVTNRKRPTGDHSRSNSSFPSSHAATSFAAASAVGHTYPKARIPAYTIATLIAYSRVYNQRHHPTDVIAGAAIGVLSARASRAYLSRLHVDRKGLAARLPLGLDLDSDGRGLLRLYITVKF